MNKVIEYEGLTNLIQCFLIFVTDNQNDLFQLTHKNRVTLQKFVHSLNFNLSNKKQLF